MRNCLTRSKGEDIKASFQLQYCEESLIRKVPHVKPLGFQIRSQICFPIKNTAEISKRLSFASCKLQAVDKPDRAHRLASCFSQPPRSAEAGFVSSLLGLRGDSLSLCKEACRAPVLCTARALGRHFS